MDFRTIAKVGVDGRRALACARSPGENGRLKVPRRAACVFSALVPSPVPSLARSSDVRAFGWIVPASRQ